jgi:hypothetical protein
MKISEAFPSKFVQAADLNGREVRLTIANLTYEKMQDQTDKLCLHFRGTDKGLILNKTNASTIADMHGDETDLWIGKQITIFPTKTDFQGKRVDAIRVKFIQPPLKPQQPIARNAPAQVPADDAPFPGDDTPFNDEIGF